MSDPAQYQSIVDAEWNIIYDKLQKCADSGAKVVLSRLAIGDLGTQFFADRDIFCAGRVRQSPFHQHSKGFCNVPLTPENFRERLAIDACPKQWQFCCL